MATFEPELEEKNIAKDETEEPPQFRVILHNDDFTTKAFVVEVLVSVFRKTEAEATHLMWHVHKNGTGLCGIYAKEIAETKVKTVAQLAQDNGYPLKTTMEPD